MPFPEVSRVIYKKNPLDQVICQLKFPPILKIETELPADFQEEIRSDFPIFSEPTEPKVLMPSEMRNSIPKDLIKHIQRSIDIKNYEFVSEDNIWKVNLTRTFIALSCKRYERWEYFRDKLRGPLSAFIKIYKPVFFDRIGLRYIDVIRRSVLGLSSTPWCDLLKPNILGLLGSPELHDYVQDFESVYELLLSDEESRVKILTKFVEHRDSSERCYMIDSDFYNTNRIAVDKTAEKLDYFNQRATRLIQWCITEELKQAMGPTKL